jgi:phage gp37-like protein
MAARTCTQKLPPAFSAWLGIRSRGRVCERWRSFVNFYLDVGPRPSWRRLLIRDDPAGAFGPGNARLRIAARYRQRRNVPAGATD